MKLSIDNGYRYSNIVRVSNSAVLMIDIGADSPFIAKTMVEQRIVKKTL